MLNKILYLELVSSTFSPFLTRFIIRKMVDEGTRRKWRKRLWLNYRKDLNFPLYLFMES